MKNVNKILFSLVLFLVGILVVNAGTVQKDIVRWNSIFSNITSSSDNNCKVSIPNEVGTIDTFLAESGTKCVMTGLKEIVYDSVNDSGGYVAIGQIDVGGTTGESFFGSITASVNNTSDTNVLLSEIVELIYDDNSASTRKLKAFALSQNRAGSATNYILKAGSSEDALYVYGGYEGGTMSSIKLDYDKNTKKITYSATYDAANEDEFFLAVYFTKYLTDYIMEASPNYDAAVDIIFDSSKYALIKDDFENSYGKVNYYTSPDVKLEVAVYAKGDINNQIVSLYDTAVANGLQNVGNNNQGGESNNNGENPNTGAFVNIFAIIALISVGTVVVLGNKRKLFKI